MMLLEPMLIAFMDVRSPIALETSLINPHGEYEMSSMVRQSSMDIIAAIFEYGPLNIDMHIPSRLDLSTCKYVSIAPVPLIISALV